MRQSVFVKSHPWCACVLGCVMAAVLAACGRSESSQSLESASEQAAAARAAELDARAQHLAQREAELQAKEEQERARQQAEAEASQREAARVAAAKENAAKKAPQIRATPPVAAAPVKAAAPAQPPIEVQPGTQLLVALASELSTKTNKPGDTFEAHLVSDLIINDRRVAPAGARVTGTITEVVSGSHSIGAVPVLGLRFEQLELAGGRQIPIRGELRQQGDSEKGRDAAKILGGTAAGAVIGHQVKHGTKGKVIGGILGGAAGAIVAHNTGTEVQLPAGAQLTIVLGEGFIVAST